MQDSPSAPGGLVISDIVPQAGCMITRIHERVAHILGGICVGEAVMSMLFRDGIFSKEAIGLHNYLRWDPEAA
jgi:hypothetical protein